MASIGTGYDLSSTTFSPDGRVFQIEYAAKAVDNSGTVLGMRCKDGVLLAVEKTIISKMLLPGTLRRIHIIDEHISLCICGLLSDGRVIVDQARDECERYKEFYGTEIPSKILADRLAQFVHLYTLHWHVRPFGCAILLAIYGDLYMIEPSGVSYRYFACAFGKGKQAARTELEKLPIISQKDLDENGKLKEEFEGLSVDEAVKKLTRILVRIHDETKDKDYEIEMAYTKTDAPTKMIAKDVIKAAKKEAEDEMEADEMGDD